MNVGCNRIQKVVLLLICWLASSTLVVSVEAFGYTASAEVCDDDKEQPEHLPAKTNRIIDDDQLSSYQRDGFIVMKMVLDEGLVNQMAKAGRDIVENAARFPQFFSVIENGLLFNGGGHSFSSSDGDGDTDAGNPVNLTSVFRQVALYSKIPQIAAELMQLDSSSQNLRVLR
jgi:hypothetical protein